MYSRDLARRINYGCLHKGDTAVQVAFPKVVPFLLGNLQGML